MASRRWHRYSSRSPARDQWSSGRKPSYTWRDAFWQEEKCWERTSQNWGNWSSRNDHTENDWSTEASAGSHWGQTAAPESNNAWVEDSEHGIANDMADEDEIDDPWYINSHDLILEPLSTKGHRFTLVLLHSCSGGPDDWMPFVHQLHLPFRNEIKVVVPCAPVRFEEHGGWSGEQNSWFEYSEDGNSPKHLAQLVEQRTRLLQLVESERDLLAGGDPRRLVLGGLSQGVALAVDVALRLPFTVGGVLALRGMVLQESIDGLPAASVAPFRLLAYHGERDAQCPLSAARASYEALRHCGVQVEFTADQNLGHACARGRQRLCGAEFHRISVFLREVWAEL